MESREELRAKLRAKIKGKQNQRSGSVSEPSVGEKARADPKGLLMSLGIDSPDVLDVAAQAMQMKDVGKMVDTLKKMEKSEETDGSDDEAPPS